METAAAAPTEFGMVELIKRPDVHIFTADKASWDESLEEIRSFDEEYSGAM